MGNNVKVLPSSNERILIFLFIINNHFLFFAGLPRDFYVSAWSSMPDLWPGLQTAISNVFPQIRYRNLPIWRHLQNDSSQVLPITFLKEDWTKNLNIWFFDILLRSYAFKWSTYKKIVWQTNHLFRNRNWKVAFETIIYCLVLGSKWWGWVDSCLDPA